MKKKKINDDDTSLPIQFTPQERDLLLDLLSIEREIRDRLQLATIENSLVTIRVDEGDLDLLSGSIAADANHTKDKKLEKKLNKLFARVDDFLHTRFPQTG